MQLISWQKLRDVVARADVVLSVVDIRNPLATFSKRTERMARELGKELIVVLNKCDLVPLWVSKGWAKYFRSEGYKTVFVSATKRFGTRKLRKAINELITFRPAVLAIVGYPKVGKSSIINALKGKDSAPTSPYPGSPGYTKATQLYRIGEDLYIIDTPGIIPPTESDDIELVIRRGPIESIPEPVKVAVKLIERILEFHPRAFEFTYRIRTKDPVKILEELALRRGWIYKTTREPNIDEAARAIIRDYLNGKIPFYVPPPNLESIGTRSEASSS